MSSSSVPALSLRRSSQAFLISSLAPDLLVSPPGPSSPVEDQVLVAWAWVAFPWAGGCQSSNTSSSRQRRPGRPFHKRLLVWLYFKPTYIFVHHILVKYNPCLHLHSLKSLLMVHLILRTYFMFNILCVKLLHLYSVFTLFPHFFKWNLVFEASELF